MFNISLLVPKLLFSSEKLLRALTSKHTLNANESGACLGRSFHCDADCVVWVSTEDN